MTTEAERPPWRMESALMKTRLYVAPAWRGQLFVARSGVRVQVAGRGGWRVGFTGAHRLLVQASRPRVWRLGVLPVLGRPRLLPEQ